MKSFCKKILTLILLMTIIYIPNYAYASGGITMDDVISDGDGFLKAGEGESPIDEEALRETSNSIYNILFTVAIVVSFAIGLIMGIQFIVGSVEDKAKIEEALIPYVVGVFVVFASFTIWKIVIEIGNNLKVL